MEQVLAELSRAEEERAGSPRREQETGRERVGNDSSCAAELAAQLEALQDELAAAQEAAAAASTWARQIQAEARCSEEALDKLHSQHERLRQDSSARYVPRIRQHAALQQLCTWGCPALVLDSNTCSFTAKVICCLAAIPPPAALSMLPLPPCPSAQGGRLRGRAAAAAGRGCSQDG